MRHCRAGRSLLSAIGRRVRLADQVRARPRHSGPLAQAVSGQHRVLRLAMMVGLAGAGFCLVLAMVGLVVALGSAGASKAKQEPGAHGSARRPARLKLRPSADYRPDRSGHPAVPESGSLPDPGARQARRFLVGKTIKRFHGSGQVKRHEFEISRPGDWGVSWTFTCQAARSGSFTIGEHDDKITNGVELSASGRKGHGIAWHLHDPGSHSLTISSQCSWVVSVVLPKH